MIEALKLRKVFGTHAAVDELDFKIEKNEIVGFIGSNGAGKTTTLRMLAAIITPTSGTAVINGHDAVADKAKARAEYGVLFGSEAGLYAKLTGKENIEYFGRLNGMDEATLTKKIDELAERLGFKDFMHKQAGTYSRGMRQKIAIARSIVHDPNIILFDEPDTGLDLVASQQVYDFLLDSKKQGKTVLFSSHSILSVQDICDKAIIIHGGKLLENKSLNELYEKYGVNRLDKIFFNLIKDKPVAEPLPGRKKSLFGKRSDRRGA
jgi:sodium transport system ATP-binding protein